MLELDRKQLSTIGHTQLRNNLADFLNRHLGGKAPLQLDQLDAELDAVIAHCQKELARFKVPKDVVITEIPKTSTGKLQKFILMMKSDIMVELLIV